MQISTAQSSWLFDYGTRLDCKPYLGPVLRARALLKRLSLRKDALETLTEGENGGIFNGPQFSRNYVNSIENGVPFMTGSSLLLADLSDLPRLRKHDAYSPKLRHLELKRGMTLISCSGTIGKTAYARSDMEGVWGSQDVLKIQPNPEKIPAGFLYAYLRSTYGVPLLIAGTYGGVIQHIEPEHITQLPVPRLPSKSETEIHQQIEKAAQLLDEYGRLIRAATEDFFSSAGLEDISPIDWHRQKESDLGFVTVSPNPYSFRTLNFSPRFVALCNKIKRCPWKALGDICLPGTLSRGGRYTRIDSAPEYGVQLIGQKELFNLRPEGRWVARKSVGDDVFVPEGSILVAAQGTLGESELYSRSEFVWGDWTKFAFSEHMLRVIANEELMLRGCLFAFFRSETAFRMLRSISSGSKLQDNHYYFLPRLPVPLLSKKDQQRIHSTVVEAYEKRHRAVAMEDDAVAKVEAALRLAR